MKTLIFTYIKKDKSVSERVLLTMGNPSNKYSGIDLTELDPVIANEFTDKAIKLHTNYLKSLQDLQVEYDLKHSYRQFLEDGVSNLEEI